MFLELQLNYLLWLQELRTSLHYIFTLIFYYITTFGEYLIPILTCAAIYWCINKKLGALIILNTAFSLIITQLFKNTACIARPWILDNRIKPAEIALPHAGGYSFPSGHSVLAVSCWGAIGLWFKKNKPILISSIILCLLIAFSRNYLGVHTLQDILVSLIMTFFILIYANKLLNWCEDGKNRDLWLAVVISAISALIVIYTYFKNYPVIHDALDNIISNSEHNKWAGFPKLGLVLGSFWGWYIEKNFVKFNPQKGALRNKIIRFIIGAILLTLLLRYTGILLKQFCDKNIGSFIHMLLASLFITVIYPWLLTKISLLHKTKNK